MRDARNLMANEWNATKQTLELSHRRYALVGPVFVAFVVGHNSEQHGSGCQMCYSTRQTYRSLYSLSSDLMQIVE